MKTMLLRVSEAAESLGLSESKVRELIAYGELETVKIGRSRRIPYEAVESFIAQLRQQEIPAH